MPATPRCDIGSGVSSKHQECNVYSRDTCTALLTSSPLCRLRCWRSDQPRLPTLRNPYNRDYHCTYSGETRASWFARLSGRGLVAAALAASYATGFLPPALPFWSSLDPQPDQPPERSSLNVGVNISTYCYLQRKSAATQLFVSSLPIVYRRAYMGLRSGSMEG